MVVGSLAVLTASLQSSGDADIVAIALGDLECPVTAFPVLQAERGRSWTVLGPLGVPWGLPPLREVVYVDASSVLVRCPSCESKVLGHD